jgi:hypothetical protein
LHMIQKQIILEGVEWVHGIARINKD